MKKLFGALLIAALMGSPLVARASDLYYVTGGDCYALGGEDVDPNVYPGPCRVSKTHCEEDLNGVWANSSCQWEYGCAFGGVNFVPGTGCVDVTQQECTELGGTWDEHDEDTYGGKCVRTEYKCVVLGYTWPSGRDHHTIGACGPKSSDTGSGQTVNVAHIDTSLVNDSSQCAQYGAVWNNNRCEFNETACLALQNSSWVDTGGFYFCDTAALCTNVTYPHTEMLFKDHLRFDTTINRCVIDDFVNIYGLGPQSVEGFVYSSANCAEYADGRNYAEGLVSSYSNQNTLDRAYLRCDVINSNSENSGQTVGEAYIDPTIVNISDNCGQYGAVWDSENSRCKFDQTICEGTAGGRWWTLSGYGVCMTSTSCRSPYRWDSTNKLCVVDGSIKDHGTGTFNTVNGFTYSSENCAAYTPGTGTTNQDIQSGAVVNPSEPAVLTYCEVDDGSSASSPFRVSRLTPTEADGTLIASGAYAKGAYNANVGNINTALTYVEDSSVETIKHATVSAENVNLSVAGFTPAGTIDVDSSNATVSGTVNVANTVKMFSQWGTTSTENGTLSGSQQVSITNGAVTGMTGTFSGPASGQLSGTGTLSNASVHVNNWVPVNPS